MKLVEPWSRGSVDPTEAIANRTSEPPTHLAVTPNIQERPETREGPDEVGDVVRLGSLERSTPCVPVVASSFVAIGGRFPFVSLLSPDKPLRHGFAKAGDVTSPSSYSCQCPHICQLARNAAGSCTYNTTISVVGVITRKKKHDTRSDPRSTCIDIRQDSPLV